MAIVKYKIRVLYSFPHKIGAQRICTTAWHQVEGVAAAGADVTVYAGSIARPFTKNVKLHTTLAFNSWRKLRIPYQLLGILRACAMHDRKVARALNTGAIQTDIVHVWPLAALHTIRAAKSLGIPAVLERPNAHTRFAYEVVEKECQRLGISMPPGHEHAYKADWLELEEAEYRLTDRILCPSDFVARTFTDKGFSPDVIARHQYGYEEKIYYPGNGTRSGSGLTMLFVGGCAPRKGLHYALDAWLQSSACEDGTFLIAGEFIPGYAELLSRQLADSSVKVLGHRNDVPDLMRQSDLLVLPTIEEGSALVTSEARGSGCVLLVSEAAGAICKHGENALVHPVGDVNQLAIHISTLNEDRALLEKLRASSMATVNEATWTAAGKKLLEVYEEIIQN